jgi:CheY-like chemotaxis protein
MPKHILLVEDDPSIIRLEERILRDAGYAVESAVDGTAALERLEATAYDAIVLDLTLPGMDGYEVARRIRRLECHQTTPILMVTASREADARQRGFVVGAVVFFFKPFTAGTFLSAVRGVTGPP